MSTYEKRVIFLDYDGVLNDPKYLMTLDSHEPKDQLDPDKVSILNRICASTGAKVVLTSSWRNDKSASDYLKRCGIPIIGCTPHRKDSDRDLEILQWQEDKMFAGDFIIIDDENHYPKAYEAHLICTREGDTLGLQPKHYHYALALFDQPPKVYASTESIYAVLNYLKDELDRIMWNIHQKECLSPFLWNHSEGLYNQLYSYDSPFANTGNHFSTDVFEVNAYDWGWDFEDSKRPQPPNFIWRDFQITWYKWYGRGLETNRKITYVELGQMLSECLDSLHQYEKDHDSVLEW